MTEPPMYINELLGCRFWVWDDVEPFKGKTRLLRNFGCSRSSGHRGWWHHGMNISHCQWKEQRMRTHPGHINEPCWKCSCGLYAYGHLTEDLQKPHVPITSIIGIVKMWGKVLTYEELIRAQYAEIMGFFDAPWYTDEMKNYIMELSVEYGYDILDFESHKDISVLRNYAEINGLMMLDDIPED